MLSNIDVRQAIAHSIDKQVLVDRVYNGLGARRDRDQPIGQPEVGAGHPDRPAVTTSTSPRRTQLLDKAGLKDPNGDGIREYRGEEHQPRLLHPLRLADRRPGIAEFVRDWLKQIGLGTTLKVVASSKLTEIIGKGDYDLFQWGWTPFVDPDPMLSYFQCSQLSKDPEDPTNYYNDANWCNPTYDTLYKAAERRAQSRRSGSTSSTRCSRSSTTRRATTSSPTRPISRRTAPTGSTGWVRQPAETGPVMFSNTSPSYVLLTPVAVERRRRALDGCDRRDHRDRRA